MCDRHKKALQPPHPSEPVVGQFIANLPCQRCIPIYPLRYAITDSPFDRTALPHLHTSEYPALQGGKHYGLRVLRPGSYVYLFYFKDGRMWTQHYLVTEDARFAALWWSEQDDDDPTPGRHARPDVFGATAYLPAPEAEVAETVWLLVSDTLLSHCRLWQIEQDTHQLRSRLATAVKPAAGPGQAHTLPSTQLKEQVPELFTQPPLAHWQGQLHFQPQSLMRAGQPMPWSECQSLPLQGVRIESEMRQALMARVDIQPLALVLQDPIGITSELNHLATLAVQARTKFAADNAHKLSSAQLISGYFLQEHPPAMRETLARQQRLVEWPQLQYFPGTYAERLRAFEAPIQQAVEDVIAWVRRAKPGHPFGLALGCFDFNEISNAREFEETVFQCIGALVHSESGRQLLALLVDAPVEHSLYWLAVARGNSEILTRIAKTAEVSKGVFDVLDKYLEEHAATPATNALIALLQALPAANRADVLVRRLRHVLEMRFNATLIQHDLSATQYLRYVREFEGHQALGPELLKRWGLSIDTSVTPEYIQVRMKLYEWVKIAETEYRVLDAAPAERPALPPKRAMPLEGNPLIRGLEQLRGPAGHLFTGVGGVVAVLGMGQSVKELKATLAAVLTIIGSTMALMGASIEIAAAGVVIRASKHGNTTLATTARIYSAKQGMAVFGAAGAGLFALSDGLKAVHATHDRNPEQARMYLGAALAGSALTLATSAGGTATAATLMGGGAAIPVLGLTPAGWAIVALIAIGSGVYFALEADAAEHGPMAIWLKHSAWGRHTKHYSHEEELEAFYSLLYRPRLTAQWDKSFASDIGTLTIGCTLPTSLAGERFAWKIQVTLDQQTLTAVEGPIIHAPGRQGIDYRRQYLISRQATMGTERGWTVTMHENAQVALEYLYQPNATEQPDLALTQPNAPAPLIFTSSGWFSDPIDEKVLAPVRAPE